MTLVHLRVIFNLLFIQAPKELNLNQVLTQYEYSQKWVMNMQHPKFLSSNNFMISTFWNLNNASAVFCCKLNFVESKLLINSTHLWYILRNLFLIQLGVCMTNYGPKDLSSNVIILQFFIWKWLNPRNFLHLLAAILARSYKTQFPLLGISQ